MGKKNSEDYGSRSSKPHGHKAASTKSHGKPQ